MTVGGFGQLLGALIRERREAAGMTQLELAEESFPEQEDGDSKARRIRELEAGDVTRPQRRNYMPICETLNIDVATIRALKAQAADANAQQDSEIEDVIREAGSAERALADTGALSRDDLELLATRFGVENAFEKSDAELRKLLTGKAEEYRTYKAEIDAIDERTKGLGNLKGAARDAADRLDFEQVEDLLSRVHEVEIEIAAETAELRARNALMRGRAEQAYHLITQAADSFGVVSPQEPARKKILQYAEFFGRHGMRFGGAGLSLSIRLMRETATDDLRKSDPWLWAAARNAEAIGLQDQGTHTGGAEGTRLLAEAVAAYRDALTVYTRTDHPVEWAATQNNLGAALQDEGTHTGGAEGTRLLAEAVAAYRDALTVYTRTDHPVEWAMTQNNLAIALNDQGTRTGGAEGTRLLAEAVAAYRDALTVYTREAHPVDWATTQNNLGTALADQGTRTGGAEGTRLLAEAVAAYRDALTVRVRADHPVQWAATQNNLGAALRNQGTRTGGAEGTRLLAEAVAAYRDALTVYTRADHPVDWAATQNNLGIGLHEQGTRTGGAEGIRLLAEAVAAWRDALTVRTRADHPVDWAMTQKNMALAERAIADHEATGEPRPHLEAALEHVEAALEVYDPKHMSYDHGTASALRDDLRKRLAAE